MKKSFGDEVREFRTLKAFSQEELARELGVSFATVNRWENGHTEPSPMARKLFDSLRQAKPKGRK
jgi:putative transcriptional regulator